MESWATEELKDAALPDKRLNQRLIKIVENLDKEHQTKELSWQYKIQVILTLPIISQKLGQKDSVELALKNMSEG